MFNVFSSAIGSRESRLESLGRVAETLEAYRWIRREDAAYRDVAERIERLSSQRPTAAVKKR